MYQMSYLMLIERSIHVNIVVRLNVIVNPAEYQYKLYNV